MKQTIIIIFALLGFSTVSYGQDSQKADSTAKSKKSTFKNINVEETPSDRLIKGESRSSGVVKPEPVIIYRDEEKILVKPN